MFNKLKRVGATTLAGMMALTLFSTPYKTVKADVLGGEVRASYENGKLTIENDYIGRTFSTTENKLKTEKITNKRTSNGITDFIPAEGSEEFKIRMTKEKSDPITLPSVSRDGWTANAESYQNASGPSDGPASNLIDGNVSSIWHTNYGGGQGKQEYPYNVLFTLNGVKKFQSFSYTPRQQGEGVNGNIKGYELWAATSDTKLAADSSEWKKIAQGNFKYDGINPIYVNLDEEVSANQLKFVAVSSNNGQKFAGGAEFNLHEEKAPIVVNDREFVSSNLELNGEPVISDTNATINNVNKTGKKVTFYEGDIADRELLKKMFEAENIDSCIHFAGLKAVGESVSKPLEYYSNNISGSLVLFDEMRNHNVKNIIFSSSATVYGDPAFVPITEECPMGEITNPYGRTKAMLEQILTDIQKADPEWNVILLRYFNPIGAHKSGKIGENPNGIPNNLMPYITQVAVGKLKCLGVFGDDYDTPDGTCIRDYIHVCDLADGHVKAVEKLKCNPGIEIYNLGTGKGSSVLDVVKTFEKASGVKIPYEMKPRRAGDVPVNYCDATKAEKELGWKAKRDLFDMCEDSWRWQKSNPNGYE
ncbi:MAG: UDP-glucose 4-epimerase GalE, partial [Clostridium sp.]|nr:UDP-glucose 4-epimerase GalE [Clostridium sp.]